MNSVCYWFETFPWWRLTRKAPCLPDVIETKRTSSIIFEHSLFTMNEATNYLNDVYCDWSIKDITVGSVTLSRKKMPLLVTKIEWPMLSRLF